PYTTLFRSMRVELVVLTIPNRLVARHWHCIARKLLKIHFRPVLIMFHRRIWLLIERVSNEKSWALQDYVIPFIGPSPLKLKTSLFAINGLVPTSTKLRTN